MVATETKQNLQLPPSFCKSFKQKRKHKEKEENKENKHKETNTKGKQTTEENEGTENVEEPMYVMNINEQELMDFALDMPNLPKVSMFVLIT